MVTDTPGALFYVAQADAAVLLEDLDPEEPSALYAQLFKQPPPRSARRLSSGWRKATPCLFGAGSIGRSSDMPGMATEGSAEAFARVRQSEVSGRC